MRQRLECHVSVIANPKSDKWSGKRKKRSELKRSVPFWNHIGYDDRQRNETQRLPDNDVIVVDNMGVGHYSRWILSLKCFWLTFLILLLQLRGGNAPSECQPKYNSEEWRQNGLADSSEGEMTTVDLLFRDKLERGMYSVLKDGTFVDV